MLPRDAARRPGGALRELVGRRHRLARVSRSNHRSPIASLDHIAELAQTLAPLLEDAAAAGAVIANGYLRLDREEWIRVVEKRSAALQCR